MKSLAVVKNLANPTNAIVMFGVSLLMFDMNYYFMKNLPGTRDEMCVMGANFTVGNILFAVALSLMVGVMFAALIEVYRKRKAKMGKSSVAGAVGMFVGTFTVFCTACSLPVISILGLSLSLNFFTTYNVLLKVLSLGLMIVGLYLLNRQLNEECAVCEV